MFAFAGGILREEISHASGTASIIWMPKILLAGYSGRQSLFEKIIIPYNRH